jgi:hypothetical protein
MNTPTTLRPAVVHYADGNFQLCSGRLTTRHSTTDPAKVTCGNCAKRLAKMPAKVPA